MLQRILDFFRSYFGWLFSKKEPIEPVIIRPEPDPEDAKPQDGSDVPTDSTTVEVITDVETVEEEPIISIEVPPSPLPAPSPEPTFPIPTSPPAKPVPSSIGSRYLWCLDNGHGEKTRGKQSPVLKNGERLREYAFNRDIVARIIRQLKEKGIDYYNVVPEEDVDNFLAGRVLRANNHPSPKKKIFVSIHSNAGTAPPNGWTEADGIETWYYHASRTGRKIAAIFQKHLIQQTNWTNRGIKSRPTNQFYVLRNTAMPAILTEKTDRRRSIHLFINNSSTTIFF